MQGLSSATSETPQTVVYANWLYLKEESPGQASARQLPPAKFMASPAKSSDKSFTSSCSGCSFATVEEEEDVLSALKPIPPRINSPPLEEDVLRDLEPLPAKVDTLSDEGKQGVGLPQIDPGMRTPSTVCLCASDCLQELLGSLDMGKTA